MGSFPLMLSGGYATRCAFWANSSFYLSLGFLLGFVTLPTLAVDRFFFSKSEGGDSSGVLDPDKVPSEWKTNNSLPTF